MDLTQYGEPIEGGIGDYTGISIITNKYAIPGQAWLVRDLSGRRYIVCTPYNDLIWEDTYKNYLASQKKQARDYLKKIVSQLETTLGLT